MHEKVGIGLKAIGPATNEISVFLWRGVELTDRVTIRLDRRPSAK
jgi:hypothetical protein